MLNKDRLIAITDGIIAVAATVMVLQLDVPEKASLSVVREQFPTLVAYIISYLQIFLAWHEHHDAFAKADVINHRVFLLNCLWLFFITLLPFVTGMVGNSPNDRASVLLFLFILCMESLFIKIECDWIEQLNQIKIVDSEIIHKLRKVSFFGYGLSAVCALFQPILGMLLVVGFCIFNVLLICIYDRQIPVG